MIRGVKRKHGETQDTREGREGGEERGQTALFKGGQFECQIFNGGAREATSRRSEIRARRIATLRDGRGEGEGSGVGQTLRGPGTVLEW